MGFNKDIFGVFTRLSQSTASRNTRLMSDLQSDRLAFKDAYIHSGVTGKAALLTASWWGTGLLPKTPGTWGSLGAIPLALLVRFLRPETFGLFFLLFTLLSIWVAGWSARLLKYDDPPEVVIDEVAGFLLTLFLLPTTWMSLLLAFILFRIFDIVKPYPVNICERLKGGAGIVLDDLVAGIYANLCLRIILVFVST